MDFHSYEPKPGGKCPCVGHRPDWGHQFYCICCCPSWCHAYCHKGGSYEKREEWKKKQQKLETERKEREYQEWLDKVNKNGGMIRCCYDWN